MGVRFTPEGSLTSVVAEDRFENVRSGSSLLCLPSETEGVAEDLTLNARSSLMEPNLDGVSDVTLSGGLIGRPSFSELSLDMPGKPLRAVKTSSPLPISSLLFLKAAFPSPLSAVCLK